MRWNHRAIALALGAALAMTVLAACNGDEATPTPSPTPTATASPTPTAPPMPAYDTVEEIDFADPLVLGPLIDHFGGGEIEAERVEFLDLTGDGTDDAFVVVASGGTAGDLGAALLTIEEGQLQVAGYIDAPGHLEIRLAEAGGGVVAAQEGVYAAGDAQCCPSQLRERTYRWDETEFELLTDQVVDNPN